MLSNQNIAVLKANISYFIGLIQTDLSCQHHGKFHIIYPIYLVQPSHKKSSEIISVKPKLTKFSWLTASGVVQLTHWGPQLEDVTFFLSSSFLPSFYGNNLFSSVHRTSTNLPCFRYYLSWEDSALAHFKSSVVFFGCLILRIWFLC